jgi:uncharacterized RDD family membrane protein YckC
MKLFFLICGHASAVHSLKRLGSDVIDVSVCVDASLLFVFIFTVSLTDDSLNATCYLFDGLMPILFFFLLLFSYYPGWRCNIEARNWGQHEGRQKVRVLAMTCAILSLKPV